MIKKDMIKIMMTEYTKEKEILIGDMSGITLETGTETIRDIGNSQMKEIDQENMKEIENIPNEKNLSKFFSNYSLMGIIIKEFFVGSQITYDSFCF